VLTLPGHFVEGFLEAVFICGRTLALFVQSSDFTGDSIILIRWKGDSIFPAIYKLPSPAEQILHMVFLDEDHPIILSSPKPPSDSDYRVEVPSPVKLRLLGLQEVTGKLSDALTSYCTSFMSEGPIFLLPPLKENCYIDQDMSWILPYHPASSCTSSNVAIRLKPSPYAEPASYAGLFVIHLGGNAGPTEDDEWQIQIAIMKSELIPYIDQPMMEVEWDSWGRDATRIFQPRPDVDSDSVPDPLKSSFMTWVENYRTASIAFDYQKELQLFHVLDFNPHTVRRLKQFENEEGSNLPGKLITEPWILPYNTSPFLVNVETSLPFYVVDFDLGDVGTGASSGEPCMIRLSSTGVLFEVSCLS
jgi:hypothetical protein